MKLFARVVALPPSLGEDHPERIAFERIRHWAFCETHPYEEQRPDRRERDPFDSAATYVVLYVAGVMVGGCRVIESRTVSEHLPIQIRKDLGDQIRHPSAEISRVAFFLKFPRPRVSRRVFYRGLCRYFVAQDLICGYASVQKSYLGELIDRFPGAITVLGSTWRNKGGEPKEYFFMSIETVRWERCVLTVHRPTKTCRGSPSTLSCRTA